MKITRERSDLLTMKDIAQLAGVSRGTVDRVLNNRGAVSPETAERIRSIMRAVNYTPNLAGKTLAIKKKQLRFGFILFDITKNPFFLDVLQGIQSRMDQLTEYGVEVEICYTDMSAEKQVSAIEALCENGLDGLAITAVNHPLVSAQLGALTQRGVPVVTVNSDVPNCGRIAFVGSDYYKSGKTAAGLMNLICGGTAKAGVLIGSPWVMCDSERLSGFVEQLGEQYPHIQIVHTAVNHSDEFESYTATQKMLEEFPEITELYLAAAGVEGACRAISDLGHKGDITVISHDAPPATRKLLEDGSIAATITQQPFVQGAKPLDILLDYLGMNIPPEKEYIYTKIEIKIRENML